MSKYQFSPIIIVILVLFVIAAGAGFVTSYSVLQKVVNNAGILGFSSLTWPLCLDCSIILGSITLLYYSINGKKSNKTWSITGFFTFTSISLNVVNCLDVNINPVVHAIAPLSLFLDLNIITEFTQFYLIETNSDKDCSIRQDINASNKNPILPCHEDKNNIATLSSIDNSIIDPHISKNDIEKRTNTRMLKGAGKTQNGNKSINNTTGLSELVSTQTTLYN